MEVKTPMKEANVCVIRAAVGSLRRRPTAPEGRAKADMARGELSAGAPQPLRGASRPGGP